MTFHRAIGIVLAIAALIALVAWVYALQSPLVVASLLVAILCVCLMIREVFVARSVKPLFLAGGFVLALGAYVVCHFLVALSCWFVPPPLPVILMLMLAFPAILFVHMEEAFPLNFANAVFWATLVTEVYCLRMRARQRRLEVSEQPAARLL
jgi:hypothetical protein